MDGAAVKAESTYGASTARPKTLKVGSEAFWVNTGEAIPEGTDAVVMVENLQVGPETVTIEEAVFPWRNVRKIGEDLVATEVVLPRGTTIGPYEIGALAAAGVLRPKVFRAPKVVFLPTGSEMAHLGSIAPSDLKAGRKLPEFNSLIVKSLVERLGGHLTVWPIVPDDREKLAQALTAAVEGPFDLAIVCAGSSAGGRDYTAETLERLGELLVHGIKAMPGKPTTLGRVGGKPVLGLPGYPVSATVAFELLGQPLLRHWQGQSQPQRPKAEARLFQDLPSRPGLEEFVRVKLGRVGENLVAVPLPRGAGTVSSLARADGLIRIPASVEGLSAERPVQVELIRALEDVEGSVMAIGSHDNALAIIDGLLREKDPRLSLTSAHVGSLGGLLALAKGAAHLAGCHLLGSGGVYNQEAILKYLPNVPVRAVRLVEREQGLMVQKGNPLGIESLADLTKPGTTMVNRQRGSGTRALLDFELDRLGLDPSDLRGYQDEECTHLNVAAAVAGGRADVGLGVLAAARALGLDFIPIGWEDYDLVVLARFMEDQRIKALLETIRGPRFKERALALGGYGVSRAGEVVFSVG
jgi:putative molybdopterin biosynthesis protein